ncbi:hypothetical protein VKT23_018329 [Stygiomarasmius scandens]|uniref:F-box domain-containing protein n=1 Tax=Marasmiellus scandens TaxID=2682957 RepID=A0ABR1IPD6_9AGAR
MTGLADLPTELLYIVVVELQTRTEMKVLRSVCQKLNSIIDPLLFASIAINTHPNALFCTTIPFCEALSSCRRNDDGLNSSHLTMHVKKLKIIATNPGAPDWQLFLPVEMQWYRIFPHALSSLINLRSVQ